MSVDTFDPSAMNAVMDEDTCRELCAFAARFEGDQLQLTEAELARFTPLAVHAGWAEKAQTIEPPSVLEALIKIFTLGEMNYASWAAGDKSPVIALVKELKRREAYDSSVTKWVKAHTTNRFLPHGSLMDRL